jgi:hypothetical protein
MTSPYNFRHSRRYPAELGLSDMEEENEATDNTNLNTSIVGLGRHENTEINNTSDNGEDSDIINLNSASVNEDINKQVNEMSRETGEQYIQCVQTATADISASVGHDGILFLPNASSNVQQQSRDTSRPMTDLSPPAAHPLCFIHNPAASQTPTSLIHTNYLQPSQNVDQFTLLTDLLRNMQSDITTQINDVKSEVNNVKFEVNNVKSEVNNVELKLESKLNTIKSEINHSHAQLDAKLNACIHAIDNRIDNLLIKHNEFETHIREIKTEQNNQTVEIRQIKLNCDDNVIKQSQHLYEIVTKDIIQQGKTLEDSIKRESNKINNLVNDKLDEQQREINQINESLDKVNKNPLPSPEFHRPIHVTCTNSDPLNNTTIPKFNGRAANPNEFLMKLKKYFERSQSSNHEQSVLKTNLHDVIELCLEGHASRWFTLIKNDVDDWHTFSDEFHKKYWNRDVQRNVKQKIENEKYRVDGKLSRSEFFTERALTLQSITPPLSDEEIINTIADCFDSLINDAKTVQNITTIKDFALLLEREDLKDYNKHKRRDHQNNTTNQKTQHHNQPQQQSRYSPTQRTENQQAYNRDQYQPRYNSNQHRSNQNNSPSNNHNNYRYNNNNRPYQNNYYSNRNQQNNQPQHQAYYNQGYPTSEQRQVCAMITQPNSSSSYDSNLRSPRTTTVWSQDNPSTTTQHATSPVSTN